MSDDTNPTHPTTHEACEAIKELWVAIEELHRRLDDLQGHIFRLEAE